jgi:hypothetical protein
MKNCLFLSRRNIETLLSKLDDLAAGNPTHCAIIKNDDRHPEFAQSYSSVLVAATEIDRAGGYNAGELIHRVVLTRADLNTLRASLAANPSPDFSAPMRSEPPSAPLDIYPVEDTLYYSERSPGWINPRHVTGNSVH